MGAQFTKPTLKIGEPVDPAVVAALVKALPTTTAEAGTATPGRVVTADGKAEDVEFVSGQMFSWKQGAVKTQQRAVWQKGFAVCMAASRQSVVYKMENERGAMRSVTATCMMSYPDVPVEEDGGFRASINFVRA
jgi:hypothetical protein